MYELIMSLQKACMQHAYVWLQHYHSAGSDVSCMLVHEMPTVCQYIKICNDKSKYYKCCIGWIYGQLTGVCTLYHAMHKTVIMYAGMYSYIDDNIQSFILYSYNDLISQTQWHA